MKRFYFKFYFIFLLTTILVEDLSARHIIGGEMTYICLGNGRYRFKLTLYRDKRCTNCATLDDIASIGIYRCNIIGGNSPCRFQNQLSVFQSIQVPLKTPFDIFPPEFPCLITPPNVVVEVGVYEFEATLPYAPNESYHIIYQRCCRNETISNIYDPDDAGATYSVEITPEAQRTCNNSPVFRKFPPTVICADFLFEFDHGATDSEADSLVYQFCEPVLGGGNNQVNSASCAGTQPNPPCPPPYNTVDYKVPLFSGSVPVSGNPPLSIHPTTGKITGIPNLSGQYLVGVCVLEFRNGVLIGKITRDFQFNVVPCSATVVADIKADSIIKGQKFYVSSCGKNTVEFINQSYQRNFINTFRWEFPQGNPSVSLDWNASITFPQLGTFNGKLLLNAGSPCADTADITLTIFPEVKADFLYRYDTCKADYITFTDRSRTGARFITQWKWDFNQEGYANRQNTNFLFRQPGSKDVKLWVIDDNLCKDSIVKPVQYFPVPEVLVVQPSKFEGCSPLSVTFKNLSNPIDSTYTILWDFGDGGKGSGLSPTHIFKSPGTYTIKMDITSPIGCKIDRTFNGFIRVRPSPIADFDYNPKILTKKTKTVTFQDLSTDARDWQWLFGSTGSGNGRNPIYTFPDTGIYKVSLVVTNIEGCKDTLVKFLDVVPKVSYFLPNAFSPNNDGRNDEFYGIGEIDGIQEFEMTIWNRWGEQVFFSTDPNNGWGGRKNNQGEVCPNGVYICLVKYKSPRGEAVKLNGFATLIR